MSCLPPAFQWLANEIAPKHLLHALGLYGIKEKIGKTGKVDNPVILDWARELEVLEIFTSTRVPWCGLFLAKVMHEAGRPAPSAFYRAQEWGQWGIACGGGPSLGDVLTFWRDGGGHVGLYVGEGLLKGTKVYWVLGGNQNDQVSIVPIAQSRLSTARRPAYVAKPANVRRVFITATIADTLSRNEA